MTGYRLKNNKKAILLGNIRTGGTRTEEVVIQLKRELHEGIAANLGLPIQKVGYQFLGVYPYWVWEGGKVLPMPGDEDDWLKTKPA
ncbi:hypothetical protein BKI52_06020 [marine bacterium AO1-C]|nr:hypothetical protein BKI52_06020 [marine bacterium AO1-C]